MIYLLDKPANWTSFDLVKKVRSLTGAKKAGHAGTLDPLATGLMIVATGIDTSKLADLTGLDKTYEAEILLGRQTDTADQEGKITGQLTTDDLRQITKDKIQEAVHKLTGVHELPVPIYSAVKVNGRPLYWYARNNIKPPEIPIRKMPVLGVRHLNTKQHDLGIIVKLELTVASGVYIRSLAEYLGQLLKVPAMLWSLRRNKIGNYDINDATTFAEISSLDQGAGN